jgi:MYXO-CTERM domain-containing protein
MRQPHRIRAALAAACLALALLVQSGVGLAQNPNAPFVTAPTPNSLIFFNPCNEPTLFYGQGGYFYRTQFGMPGTPSAGSFGYSVHGGPGGMVYPATHGGGHLAQNFTGSCVEAELRAAGACNAGTCYSFSCYSAVPGKNGELSQIQQAAQCFGRPQVGHYGPVISFSGQNTFYVDYTLGAHGYPHLAAEFNALQRFQNHIDDGVVFIAHKDGKLCAMRASYQYPAGTTMLPNGPTFAPPPPACRSFRMTKPFSVRPSVTGLVVLDVGGCVLHMKAEEYAGHVDAIDASSKNDCMPPINLDAAIPYNVVSKDYWQQVGYYYDICDDPPPDPKWFGSNPLPPVGSPTYDRDMLRCIAESRGKSSRLYQFRSRGIDPCPVGYVPVWVLEPAPDFRRPDPFRDPFRLHPEPQRLILRQRQEAIYGPWGWRKQLDGPCEVMMRGGRLQVPGGVDPPYVADAPLDGAGGCGCTTPGKNRPSLGWTLALAGLAAAWALRRRC